MLKATNFDIPLFEQWLKNKGTIKEGTIYVYTGSVQRFLSKDPDLENVDDYNNFLLDVSIKKRCSHYFSAIRQFVEFKITNNDVKQKLFAGMLRPKRRFDYKVERKYLPTEKLFEVINYLGSEKHRIIALIQVLTGVRAGDIIRLKRGGISPDIYEEKEVLKLALKAKGDKRNVVYIHDEIAQKLIWNYVLNNVNYGDYYFIELSHFKNRGRDISNQFKLEKMNYQWYWSDLKQALNTANVDMSLFATHDFRRCFARRAWTKYKDIYVLQKLLNHTDPKITLRYLESSGLHTIDYHKEMQKLD